jgi:hypothetical protein
MHTARKLAARAGSLSLVFTFVVAAGCSSNPDNSSAWSQFITAYCQRLQGCFPGEDGGAGFAQAYPNGVSQCVQANPLPAQYSGTISTCSQAQITACVSDTNALACSAVSLSAVQLAASCSAC